MPSNKTPISNLIRVYKRIQDPAIIYIIVHYTIEWGELDITWISKLSHWGSSDITFHFQIHPDPPHRTGQNNFTKTAIIKDFPIFSRLMFSVIRWNLWHFSGMELWQLSAMLLSSEVNKSSGNWTQILPQKKRTFVSSQRANIESCGSLAKTKQYILTSSN